MQIRQQDTMIKLPPRPQQDGDAPTDLKGIMNGGCIPPGTWPPIVKPDFDRLEFSKKDRDRDGSLSCEEFGWSRHDSLVFSKHDVNDDGKLTYDEYKNGREFDAKNQNDGFMLIDEVLTSDEYGVGKKNQDEFRRYDTNHDGKVTREEFQRGRFLDKFLDLPRPFPKPFPRPLPFPKPPVDLDPRPLPFPLPPNDHEIRPLPGKPGIKLGDLVEKAKAAAAAKAEGKSE